MLTFFEINSNILWLGNQFGPISVSTWYLYDHDKRQTWLGLIRVEYYKVVNHQDNNKK